MPYYDLNNSGGTAGVSSFNGRSGAVTFGIGDFPSLTENYIWKGNASNTATAVPDTGGTSYEQVYKTQGFTAGTTAILTFDQTLNKDWTILVFDLSVEAPGDLFNRYRLSVSRDDLTSPIMMALSSDHAFVSTSDITVSIPVNTAQVNVASTGTGESLTAVVGNFKFF